MGYTSLTRKISLTKTENQSGKRLKGKINENRFPLGNEKTLGEPGSDEKQGGRTDGLRGATLRRKKKSNAGRAG